MASDIGEVANKVEGSAGMSSQATTLFRDEPDMFANRVKPSIAVRCRRLGEDCGSTGVRRRRQSAPGREHAEYLCEAYLARVLSTSATAP